jgi:hypothetical protein
MSTGEIASPSAARRESRDRAALIAAFREGLGLVAIVIRRDAGGFDIAVAARAGAGDGVAGEDVAARCWCRRAADAERVAAAATARLKRSQSRGDAAADAIAVAAKRLAVALYSEDEVCLEAAGIIARVDDEFERLRRGGELTAVNRSYRDLRVEASARGEKVPPYAEWIGKYRQNLVRQLAAALRQV